ncbi:hypothetical protein D4764_18G0008680 [Takifugu flavidus]|uniref:Uncharacterized protein n=1 Tax=Takifugu flavidus TaxID=433684 RepID=A0A5C6NRA1_9TELE|nr:hypothetical protein D4764_18G0008680 [Takifugu flavidus]
MVVFHLSHYGMLVLMSVLMEVMNGADTIVLPVVFRHTQQQ